MKPKGILFSGPMVKAILAGTKTQTRRIVKPQPPERDLPNGNYFKWDRVEQVGSWLHIMANNPHGMFTIKPTHPVGSILYVKETWKPHCDCAADGSVTPEHPLGTCVKYRADGAMVKPDKWSKGEGLWCEVHENETHWRPSIFMPRWASRLWLEVTGVRVERLNSITEADAIAEGVNSIQEYELLWNSINGKECLWKTDPFVWVITFKRTSPL